VAGAARLWRDRAKGCAPGSLCATKPVKRWNVLALAVLGALVVGLAAFPYYSATVAAAVNHQSPRPGVAHITRTATFGIAGMSCPACAAGLQASLQRLPGVVSATVDYDARRASVTYDPAKQTPEAFKSLVRQAGYEPR
jgi:copper chaperone CopZ